MKRFPELLFDESSERRSRVLPATEAILKTKPATEHAEHSTFYAAHVRSLILLRLIEVIDTNATRDIGRTFVARSTDHEEFFATEIRAHCRWRH